jgi:protein-disulfide isomerase/uncharacterized membrane protein
MAISVTIIGICLYLSNHYFEVQFPTSLAQTTFCDFNSFWNCDAATFSSISNIACVPIAILGLVIGLCLLAGSFFPSESVEGLNKIVVYVNALGCLILFIYSLVVLKSLCPFCSLYYLCSWIMAFLFYKYGVATRFCPKVAGLFLILAVVVVGGVKLSVLDSEKKQSEIAQDLRNQYNNLPMLGDPKLSSIHRLASSTENFAEAPIRLSIFSDFQCPACKKLSEQVPKIAKRYAGKINIQYFFFPLDNACNEKMTQSIHPYACQASYVATCSADKFIEVHDHIFENQANLSFEWLKNYAKKLGVEACVSETGTQERVVSYVKQGNDLSVASTPTLVINGKRIDGLLPLKQVYILLDSVLK